MSEDVALKEREKATIWIVIRDRVSIGQAVRVAAFLAYHGMSENALNDWAEKTPIKVRKAASAEHMLRIVGEATFGDNHVAVDHDEELCAIIGPQIGEPGPLLAAAEEFSL